MKFEHDGFEHVIEFERSLQLNPGFRQGKPIERKRVRTTAKVIKRLKDGSQTVVREATVAHYSRDKFSYEGGRKAALTKALYDAPTLKGGIPLMGQPLSKEFRTQVWNAYHGRTADGAKRIKA